MCHMKLICVLPEEKVSQWILHVCVCVSDSREGRFHFHCIGFILEGEGFIIEGSWYIHRNHKSDDPLPIYVTCTDRCIA